MVLAFWPSDEDDDGWDDDGCLMCCYFVVVYFGEKFIRFQSFLLQFHTMLFSRVSRGASRLNRVVRRGAADDGWLKKNMRVEEHAGFRESTYKTYEFTPREFMIHSALLFIPGFLLAYGVSNDMKADFTRIGRPEFNFGVGDLRNAVADASNDEDEE